MHALSEVIGRIAFDIVRYQIVACTGCLAPGYKDGLSCLLGLVIRSLSDGSFDLQMGAVKLLRVILDVSGIVFSAEDLLELYSSVAPHLHELVKELDSQNRRAPILRVFSWFLWINVMACDHDSFDDWLWEAPNP
jgi:hypothetical protein